MSAVADVLNGAADLIERDGWMQGGFTDGTRRCASQAIYDATARGSNLVSFHEARDVFAESVQTELTWGWNDIPGRTKADVVAALRAAAEKAS